MDVMLPGPGGHINSSNSARMRVDEGSASVAVTEEMARAKRRMELFNSYKEPDCGCGPKCGCQGCKTKYGK